jgi:hypothetical protein
LLEIAASNIGWRTLGSIGMTSISIARYSENNLNGVKSFQHKLVRLVLRELGVPLLGSWITATNKFQATKVSLALKNIKLMAV